MAYLTDGKLGVKLDAVSSDIGATLGETHDGTDGTVWQYVQASGAITQYDAVAIDENYQAAALTKALADAGHQIGFAQVAFTDNQYGWVARTGSNISVRLKNACAADVSLYTTDTAGMLDDTDASQTKISGVVAVTISSASGDPEEVVATWPFADQPA